MMRVWLSSETFTHGFIAVPVAAWMIWRNRADWSPLPALSWWPALLVMAMLGLGWVVGHIAGVGSVEQLAAVATIPAVLAALVGLPIAAALAFPLAFLFFAVPIGDFLTPILMDYTADATVLALQWTGIPVYREGLHFTVPSGRWSVVEACSGLRYLIASLALGVLFAYLQFRTLKYRLAFMALSLIVPIIANWIRAYLIVMIGHLSDMKLAAGADHLIYGWVFFGVVMMLLFWIGSRWNEPATASDARDAAGLPGSLDGAAGAQAVRVPARVVALAGGSGSSTVDLIGAGGAADSGTVDTGNTDSPGPGAAARHAAAERSSPAKAVTIAILAALIAFGARPLAQHLLDATETIAIAAPVSTALGPVTSGPAFEWAPAYTRPSDSARVQVLASGQPVEAHVFYYARQHETQEMIHGANNLQRLSDPKWPIRSRSLRDSPAGPVEELRIGHGGHELLIWHWYQVAGRETANAYRAKGLTALALLTGQGDHSIAVALATPVAGAGAEALDQARKALSEVAGRLAPVTAQLSRGELPAPR